jgi:hypothetical protein
MGWSKVMIPIPILDAVFKIVDKLIPDPQAKAQAKIDILKMEQEGEFKQMDADLQMSLSQAEINKAEAASSDPFTSGWRPFVGWVCGAGFATQFVIGPWGTWIAALNNHPIPFPQMDMTTMMPLLFGMLGLGAYRSYDKMKGTAK